MRRGTRGREGIVVSQTEGRHKRRAGGGKGGRGRGRLGKDMREMNHGKER